ncbi:MAG TPA: hypothetical protein P5048_01365, partial [Chlamydiales bacterium]|nr:hypothetical protein [Chlamydiales bacterium]
YYHLLQAVREQESAWKDWVLFILDAVEKTSYQTIDLVRSILKIMQAHKVKIRENLPKVYSQDLLNNLFNHPYTKIEFVMNDLNIHRNTARKYLEDLVQLGILNKIKKGKESYYVNQALFDLLMNSSKS